jgi:hypothetical protein
MRYGRGGLLGGLRRLEEELGPYVRRGGCMLMSMSSLYHLLHLAPLCLADMHVWPSQCGKLRSVLHCGT